MLYWHTIVHKVQNNTAIALFSSNFLNLFTSSNFSNMRCLDTWICLFCVDLDSLIPQMSTFLTHCDLLEPKYTGCKEEDRQGWITSDHSYCDKRPLRVSLSGADCYTGDCFFSRLPLPTEKLTKEYLRGQNHAFYGHS